jgi:hypothetical protein
VDLDLIEAQLEGKIRVDLRASTDCDLQAVARQYWYTVYISFRVINFV